MAAQETASGPGKVTVPMLQVLDTLLSEPSRNDWFALQICRSTHLGSGTVVQILFRLERWGWLESRWEDLDHARDNGRPRRRFYVLTGTGARSARSLIESKFPRITRWQPA
jgi:PadR family transcriptional regulator PadR